MRGTTLLSVRERTQQDEMAILLEAIEQLRGEVREIRRCLEPRGRPDADRHAPLLQAVASAVSDRAFSASEVIIHARVVDGVLRQTLDAAGATTGRKLGKLFRRIEGRDVAGLRLERIGADAAGIIWRVRVS